MTIREYILERFINSLNGNDYVGVEIEMPIVNNEPPHIIKTNVICNLFRSLSEMLFVAISYDNQGNVIAARNIENGDTISLEYSLNTLEFSLNKASSIFELESRFLFYYDFCCNILRKDGYSIIGCGINPYYKVIDRNCLDQDRYLTIERLLRRNECEIQESFCAYCCSVQTHINVSCDNVIDILNMFTRIEGIKSNMFANSYMDETGLEDSRSYLWRASNFGPMNCGENPIYCSIDNLVDDYLERNLFFVERNGEYLIFEEKQKIKDYLSQKQVLAKNKKGECVTVIPQELDFENFRSYRGVELTKYGTLEIRTDCTQSIDNIFRMVAFNVGVAANAEYVNNYIHEHGTIGSDQLIAFAVQGLKMRGYGEERFWDKSLK